MTCVSTHLSDQAADQALRGRLVGGPFGRIWIVSTRFPWTSWVRCWIIGISHLDRAPTATLLGKIWFGLIVVHHSLSHSLTHAHSLTTKRSLAAFGEVRVICMGVDLEKEGIN